MSKTYSRILKPLKQPRPYGHAERNVANLKSLAIANRYFKKQIKEKRL